MSQDQNTIFTAPASNAFAALPELPDGDYSVTLWVSVHAGTALVNNVKTLPTAYLKRIISILEQAKEVLRSAA